MWICQFWEDNYSSGGNKPDGANKQSHTCLETQIKLIYFEEKAKLLIKPARNVDLTVSQSV